MTQKRKKYLLMIGGALCVIVLVGVGLQWADVIGGWKMAYPPRIPGTIFYQSFYWNVLSSRDDLWPSRQMIQGGSAGVLLSTWLFEPRDQEQVEPKTCLIAVHGICANKAIWHWLVPEMTSEGLAVCMFDLRAHGETEGGACSFGHLEREDVGTVIRYLRKVHDYEQFVLLGHSLGAAVVLQSIMQDSDIAGVVAIAPFADLSEISEVYVRRFVGMELPELLALTIEKSEDFGGYDVEQASPLSVLATTTKTPPILFIHGDQDINIPSENSDRLYHVYDGPKQREVYAGASHYSILGKQYQMRLVEDIKRFFQEQKIL